MTRDEAIYRLKNTAWLGTDKDREETGQAVDMAIKALEELPKRRKEVKRWKRKALKEKPVVRCKECKNRYTFDCPMCVNDFYIVDSTQDEGFCYMWQKERSEE